MNVTVTAIVIFSLAGISTIAALIVCSVTARATFEKTRERERALHRIAKR
jgi:hypothetical protein